METVTDFIFLASKITANSDYIHEIKRHLLLARKTRINLDSTLKSRDITLPTKVHIVKAMVFPVPVWTCELDHKGGWVLKNWGFQTLVLKKTPESPWTARRSVLNIHWKDECWSWGSNTLATWCEELIHWKRPWCWERLKAGGEGGDRG